MQHDWKPSFPRQPQLNLNASDPNTQLLSIELEFDSTDECVITAYINNATYYSIRKYRFTSSEIVMDSSTSDSGAAFGAERFKLEHQNGKLILTDTTGKKDIFHRIKKLE